jgi:hypothetical protein
MGSHDSIFRTISCIITTQKIESFLEDQHHKTITIPVAPLHTSYHAKIGLIVIVKMVFSQDYLSVVPIFLVIVTPVVVAYVPRNRRQSPGNLVNRDLLYPCDLSSNLSQMCQILVPEIADTRPFMVSFSAITIFIKRSCYQVFSPVFASSSPSGSIWQGCAMDRPEGQADQNRGLQSDAPDIGIETWDLGRLDDDIDMQSCSLVNRSAVTSLFKRDQFYVQ